MKLKSFLILFFISLTVFGQQTKEWLRLLNNPKNIEDKLSEENVKAGFVKYDFSTLFVPRHDFLGYIGSDYRRIKIFFTTIIKDSANSEIYRIKGVSLVGDNKCDFSGTITINQVRLYKTIHFGADNEYSNKGLISQGVLIGDYEFKENPDQNHSGIFQGVMTLYWYLDKFGIIYYDNIQWFSDIYKNNQYVGTWSKYNSPDKKTCNWGEYRIPFSGDLDIGAGEFSPNPLYLNKGWEDLRIK